MKRVFVSSVIKGFEDYRQVARQAVELMGHRPVMSEDFGARAYSSEMACITEVEKSDIYIGILGAEYGYETDKGISVTQAEFRAAKAAGRPSLIFVQKHTMEIRQAAFRSEVEDYATGFFRASFTTPAELKDEVIKGLRQLDELENAMPNEQFDRHVEESVKKSERLVSVARARASNRISATAVTLH